MGVSKNRGKTPKMEGFKMENPIHPWMIWGVPTHHLRKHPKEGNFRRFRHFWPQNWRCEKGEALDSIRFQIAKSIRTIPGSGVRAWWWSHGYILANPGISLIFMVFSFHGLVHIYVQSSHGSCGKWRLSSFRDLDNLWKLFSLLLLVVFRRFPFQV